MPRRLLLRRQRVGCAQALPCRFVQRRIAGCKLECVFALPIWNVLFPAGSSSSYGMSCRQLLCISKHRTHTLPCRIVQWRATSYKRKCVCALPIGNVLFFAGANSSYALYCGRLLSKQRFVLPFTVSTRKLLPL